MTFEQLNIEPRIVRALSALGYKTPTPIQQRAIPPALKGRDVLGCAQTGTGKTAAFAIPILQTLSAKPYSGKGKRPIHALVLTPTRELALQIDKSFADYGRHLPLRCQVIFGGVSQVPQVQALQRGVDILTATPGRLNDLIGQGHIDLSQVQILVLDEADRMLDMGFIHDVRRVLNHVPQRRQTLFFSATMPKEIQALVDQILTDPVRVAVTPVSSTVDAIEQCVYFVDKANKRKLLIKLLEDPALQSVLVFTRTKHGADRVARELNRAHIPALAIHGNKSQTARQLALENFKHGKVRVLVATDIAARGIDIDHLSHVVNLDLPEVPETYVHRIGRTGRAGLSGTAISFCDALEKPYLQGIQKLIQKRIPVVARHPFVPTQQQPAQQPPAAQAGQVHPAGSTGEPARRRRRRGGRNRRKPAGATGHHKPS